MSKQVIFIGTFIFLIVGGVFIGYKSGSLQKETVLFDTVLIPYDGQEIYYEIREFTVCGTPDVWIDHRHYVRTYNATKLPIKELQDTNHYKVRITNVIKR